MCNKQVIVWLSVCTNDNPFAKARGLSSPSCRYTNKRRRSRKFCYNFDNVCFSWWGERRSKYHLKWVIIGRKRNAVQMAFRSRACNGPTSNASRGSGSLLLRNPRALWFSRGTGVRFPGGGVRTPVPPLDTHMNQTIASAVILGTGKHALLSVQQSLPPAGCPSMTTRDISLQYWAYGSIYHLCNPRSPCGHVISTDTAALRLGGWRVWATQEPTRGSEGWVTRWTRSRKARSWQKWRQVCGIRQKFQWSVNIKYNFKPANTCSETRDATQYPFQNSLNFH